MKKKRRNSLLLYFEYLLVLAFCLMIKCLPINFAYFIAEKFSNILFLFNTRPKRFAIQHLLHAGIAKDRPKAEALARTNFAHFAKFAVEFCKTGQLLKQENIHEIVSLEGSEKSKALFFNPGKLQQAIVVTAHIGNWEMAGFAYTMLSGMPLLTVMRPFENIDIGKFINTRRLGYNHSICPKKGALKSLLVGLKNGKSICFLADQHASTSEGMETVFFGHPARTHVSPGILHLRTGIPILPAFMIKEGNDFKFKIVMSDPINYKPTEDKEADLKAIAQLYTTEIEKIVARYPEQWLWQHRRWLDLNR